MLAQFLDVPELAPGALHIELFRRSRRVGICLPICFSSTLTGRPAAVTKANDAGSRQSH